jgi:hypothetical protein
VDDGTDHVELQDQIAQLPIENPLPLDEFLNPEDDFMIFQAKIINSLYIRIPPL